MFDSQSFGILGPFHHTLNRFTVRLALMTYNDPYGLYNHTQNRADGKEKPKSQELWDGL